MSELKFGIVITARMRHGDLWKAVKKLGTATALAEYLGTSPTVLGEWINLKGVPSLGWLQTETGLRVADRLFLICGKPVEELWPIELRAAIKGGKFGEQIERHYRASVAELACNAERRLLLPSPEETAIQHEGVELLTRLLDRLKPRLRRIIVLRYGLEGERTHTLEEVGWELKVTKERARSLEISGLRELRSYGCELSESAIETMKESDQTCVATPTAPGPPPRSPG